MYSRPVLSGVRLTRTKRAVFRLLGPAATSPPPFFLNSVLRYFSPRQEEAGSAFGFCVTSFNFRSRTRKLLDGTCSSQLGLRHAADTQSERKRERCDPKLFLLALCEGKLLLAGAPSYPARRGEKLLSVRDKPGLRLWRVASSRLKTILLVNHYRDAISWIVSPLIG